MPMYEYLCQDCGRTTETLRAMAQADAPIACAHCDSRSTQRQLSVFAATTGGQGESSPSLPMGGCGRCGDPQGSCAM